MLLELYLSMIKSSKLIFDSFSMIHLFAAMHADEDRNPLLVVSEELVTIMRPYYGVT